MTSAGRIRAGDGSGDLGIGVRGVSKFFGGQAALADVTVSLAPGGVLGLVGHNGAGKSTLLRVLAGAHQPDIGTVEIDGVTATLTGPTAALHAGIVTVYQELRIIGALTVTENIFLGREVVSRGQLAQRQMRRRAAELCEEFGIPAGPLTTAGHLPVAHQQMLEVAAGLDRGAKYLLLDEPTTALEAEQIDHLLQTVRRIATSGVGVAIVDHKLDEVFAVADRVVALADGRVVLDAPVGEVSREDVVTAIVGRELDGSSSARAGAHRGQKAVSELRRADSPSVLSALEVCTDFCGPVTLDVPAGKVTGLYGLVGAGRTEFVRALLGVDPIRSGNLVLRGRRFQPRGPADAIRCGIASVSEDRKREGILPQLDSRVNAAVSVLQRFTRTGVLSRRAMAAGAGETLASVGVRGDITMPVSSMSGGNQQKVMIARALMSRPQLLVLDEPTKGVDIAAKAEIHQLVRQMAHEQKIGVLVVSSEEEEILGSTDRVVIFTEGATDGRAYDPAGLDVRALRRLALPTATVPAHFR